MDVAWVASAAAIVAVVLFGHFALRPLLVTLMEIRRQQNEMLPLLNEIAKHVRTDSGTSLLDIVHRLDKAAKSQVTAAEVMAVNIESAHALAVEQRRTLQRIEAKADQVTVDLEEAQERADDAMDRGEEAGVASDIASSTPKDDA